MTALDQYRAAHWLTAPHGTSWRGPCDYCPEPAVIAHDGPVVERKACLRHNPAAFDATQFDRNLQNAVDTGRCKAVQGPDGQWSGGFRN